MPQTLASSVTPLCPVAEFLKRVDNLAVAKLASDVGGTAVPEADLPTDPNVKAVLLDASGVFESAVMMGQKYMAADLQLLLTTPCAAQGMMFRIISDIAWTFLFERRPNVTVTPPASVQRSLQWLELLSQGKRIFAFIEVQNATVMKMADVTTDDVMERQGVVAQGKDYFGVRSDERRNW